jgi:hypothetical protein
VDPQRSSPFVQFEYSLNSSLMAVFGFSRAFYEARDLPVLSVARALLQRSEEMVPHGMIRAIAQAMRGRVELPLMTGPCVGYSIVTRGISGVRVTRLMMPRQVR